MYLEHFGLTEPPFKITPVTDFFFSGANRGEILDALIYAIRDSEGIIKVSGEVGSGKTMLCRMLLDRLPSNIKAIYLANPSMSRDELLYAIADRLDLSLEGQRVNVILQTLQNQLEAMYERGERCVVLVDEAHAMPLDTLEELRLLYNLQVGKHKLIQIVLFGQPELDEKLNQSNMRQLKDRIVHHFSILPISRKVINDYLMFRMRAAGYKGPDIFSPAAVLLIGKSSQGLMRRVNILADKALLAAFVENTHKIEVRHVQAAIRDSEMIPMRSWSNRKSISMAGGVALLAATLAGAGWFVGQNSGNSNEAEAQRTRPITVSAVPNQPPAASSAVTAVVPVSAASTASDVAATSSVAAPPSIAATSSVADTSNVTLLPLDRTLTLPAEQSSSRQQGGLTKLKTQKSAPAPHMRPASDESLLQQRLDATGAALSGPRRGNLSIQLFYTDDIRPERMERFLGRAQRLGKFAEIYIVPIKLNGKDGYRVLYGLYANNDAARTGMEELPQRYKDAFAPTLYLLDGSQNTP
ncbi:AAA family ATPase [Sideroxydans sp. CL21]|uniref:ExeA family protein n=1 Tax=Sideroxydans sp. CL21 TaxID=2600596 RepID=UPI0012A9B439|nr:AAA family ATPase [Sideroxydans sp. CL21]VVC84964.1 general secretion pathway protein, ATPase [Sideroxydans sp. CL21]